MQFSLERMNMVGVRIIIFASRNMGKKSQDNIHCMNIWKNQFLFIF